VKTYFEPTDKQNLYIRQPGGVYYARLYVNGGTKWISLQTRVKGVAKTELAKRMQQTYGVRRARAATVKGSATLGDLAAIYLHGVDLDTDLKPESKHYRHKTVKSLMRSWPEFAAKAPAKVSESECKEWANRYHQKYSPTLYNNTLDTVRHIFNVAIERGLIARNPALVVAKVKVTPKKLELPSSEQFKSIVEHIRGMHGGGCAASKGCGDLVEFLAYSGCRISEAARVRWTDVQWPDIEQEKPGRIYIGPSKYDLVGRYIPLLEPMLDLLNQIKGEPRWFRSDRRRGGGFILSVADCEAALTNACTKANATRITHHDLRHLFATRCIESGVDIPTVSRWLGHKDGGALAMKTYGHLRDEHSAAMAAKVRF
jgi:integrase